MMDYFRRPVLAGNNLTRTNRATIRGSLRRADADGTSTVPYFIGANTGETLLVSVDGAAATTVTLTSTNVGGSSLAEALADINVALNPNAEAFDSDGTISIRSLNLTVAASIQVTGGSASTALGFDVSLESISARVGEIPSTPDGRLGNRFGTSFLSRNETISAESVSRGMARLAANADVLWADHAKDKVTTKVVAFSVGTGGLYITPTSTQRMLTTGNSLSLSSLKSDLVPFYQLIDTVTKQPANSQVVAVVRGAPVGDPPYANSPSWTDTTGKNVLGQSLTKTTKTISSITGGRIIKASSGSFVTDGVVAGDFAEITGATNTLPWSNNGQRWVVESVLSETVLTLRPMSKSELEAVAFSPTDVQPVVELNNSATSLLDGSIVIRNGTFAHNVTLVVRPPIPTNAVYELRASVPSSLRDDLAFDPQFGSSAAALDLVNELNPVENGTVSGLVATLAGPNVAVTAGTIRVHGKAFNLPARTFLPGEFVDGTNYLYWDEATSNFAISLTSSSWSSVLNPAVTTNKGHLIAAVIVSGGAVVAVFPWKKIRGENAVSVTVGVGGQFADLVSAALWASTLSADTAETSSATGSYPHFEFVVVSDLTISGNFAVAFSLPGVTVRGVTPDVRLTMVGTNFATSGPSLTLRDLTFVPDVGNTQPLISLIGAGTTVTLHNLKQSGSNSFGALIQATGGGFVTDVLVENCNLKCSNVVKADVAGPTTSSVHLINCEFTAGAAPCTVLREDALSTWGGDVVLIDGCRFLGAWRNDSAPLVVSTSASTVRAIIRDSEFQLFNHGSATTGSMFTFSSGYSLVENVQVTAGKIPVAVNAPFSASTVRDSKFRVNPEGSVVAVKAQMVDNCNIEHEDTDSNPVGGIGVDARKVTNCTIGTYFSYAIKSTSFLPVELENNLIVTTAGTFSKTLEGGIWVSSSTDTKIHGNTFLMAVNPVGTGLHRAIVTTGPVTNLTINGNKFSTLEGGTAFGSTSGTVANLVFSENIVIGSSTTQQGVDISSVVNGSITGNSVVVAGAGSVALRSGSSPTKSRVEGNLFEADVAYTSAGTGLLNFIGNNFVGTIVGMRGQVDGNNFSTISAFTNAYLSNNRIAGTATFDGYVNISGCDFGGDVSASNIATRFQFNNSGVAGLVSLDFTTAFVPHILVSGCAVTGSFTATVADSSFRMSDCLASGGLVATSTVGDIDLQGSHFTTLSVTNGANADAEFRMSGCRIDGLSTVQSQNFSVNGCSFIGGGTHTFNGNSAGSSSVAEISSCDFSFGTISVLNTDRLSLFTSKIGCSAVTVSGTGSISSCRFTNPVAVSFTSSGSVDGCTFEGVATISTKIVDSCKFNTHLVMSGSDQYMELTNCTILGGTSFTADVTQPRYLISGNSFIPGSITTHGIIFPAFTASAGMSIRILGNSFWLGVAFGTIARCHGIFFTGHCERLTLSGNTIEYSNQFTSPGGLGLFEYALLYVSGTTGASNTGNCVSSNRMKKTDNLTDGGLELKYYFWYFGEGNEGTVIGAGNVLESGASITSTTPYSGQSFRVPAGVTTPYVLF